MEEIIKHKLKKQVKDFAIKIHPIYTLLNWKWCDKNVPTVTEIEDTLYMLINDMSDDAIEHSTGGLYVCQHNEDGIREGSIGFRIEESVYK